MQTFDAITSLPHTFHGGLALNQRTVANAVATLLRETVDGNPIGHTPIRIAELTNVLLLLEFIAMSNAMYLDGTLPPGDVKHLKSILFRLGAQADLPVEVDFIRPPATDLPRMFQEAAEAASLLIDRDLDRLDAQNDEPIEGETTGFVETMRIAKSGGPGLAQEFARKTAADVAEGREAFRGAKCVAGLLLAESEPVPVAARASALLDRSDERTRRKTISMLINRFRINYVNSLAGKRDAVYLADATIEDLKAAQVLLFARYLASRIAASHRDSLSDATRSTLDEHFSTVPLGFAILINCRNPSTLGLLDEAMRIRDLKFCAAAARATPQTRYVHQLDADELASFQDYLFKGKWIGLMNEAERKALGGSELREIKIPAAVGGVVGAILGAMAAGPLGAAAGSLAGTLVQHLGEELAAGRLGNRSVQVDQYRRLDVYLSLAARNDRLATPFREKVETVFGRPLVP